MTFKKKPGLRLALTLVLAGAGSLAMAQGVEPTLAPANPALAAGQQAMSPYGSTPMGETGVLVREPLPPARPIVVAPPPPPPPPPPVVVPPPPPPPPPPPLPPPPRRDRN